jgi:hypothetical protein
MKHPAIVHFIPSFSYTLDPGPDLDPEPPGSYRYSTVHRHCFKKIFSIVKIENCQLKGKK